MLLFFGIFNVALGNTFRTVAHHGGHDDPFKASSGFSGLSLTTGKHKPTSGHGHGHGHTGGHHCKEVLNLFDAFEKDNFATADDVKQAVSDIVVAASKCPGCLEAEQLEQVVHDGFAWAAEFDKPDGGGIRY